MAETKDSDGLLNPEFLQHIEAAVLRARLLVEGTLSGIHKSPHKGSSIEFLEHKQYSPGDEIRHIDWKLVARSDKYYIKQFEDETNLRAVIVMDASGSMDYGEGATHKLNYAVHLASGLIYLLLKQADTVGLLSQTEDGGRLYIPPRSQFAHFRILTNTLFGLKPRGVNHWIEHLEELAGTFHRRGMFIILSDLLLGDGGNLNKILRILRTHLHDVMVLHVLHGDEREFPFQNTAVFKSLEDERKLLVDPRSLREHYLRELAKFTDEMRNLCLENEADYASISTADPIERALATILLTRMRT